MPDGSLSILYSDPLGIYEPAVTYALGSNVRFGDLSLAQAAELGEPAMSTVDVEDPGGIRNIVGLRAIVFKETAAASNNQIVLRGVIQDRTYKRSDDHALITGADRLIVVDIADYNWHLGARILVDADAKRPAESPGDRIRWLLSNAAHINLNDYGHVTYPTSPTLEANDYRGQRPKDLLADCAVEGQYNFWCDFNEAHGTPELFFMDPDASEYSTSIRASNVLSDVDSLSTFAPYDAELRRSPSRITYGAYVAYNGGSVYVRNDTTGAQFAKIDQTAPMANVKSATRARRIGDKFLAKNNSESDRLSFSIKVPAAQVNDVRAGHLMSVKFSHLPGYEDWTYVRILQRGIIQEDEGGEDYYRLQLEAVPVDAAVSLLQWGYAFSVYNAPYPVVLDNAPSFGNTLVAFCWSTGSTSWTPTSISGGTWIEGAVGLAFDAAQYGGPGPGARLSTYHRAVVQGESNEVTITPGDDFSSMMVIEVAGTVVPAVTSSNGTLTAGQTRTMSSAAGGLMLVAWTMQRTDYAPADSVDAGSDVVEIRDAYVGTGAERPHTWVAYRVASAGSLSVSGSPAFNAYLDRWGVFSVAYVFES